MPNRSDPAKLERLQGALVRLGDDGVIELYPRDAPAIVVGLNAAGARQLAARLLGAAIKADIEAARAARRAKRPMPPPRRQLPLSARIGRRRVI
jgi:hypothetical protein